MKLSIVELKRRLPVGAEFTATFIGPLNTRVIGNGMVTDLPHPCMVTKRRVYKQGEEMSSMFLDGPKAGKFIFLDWKGIKAREDGGAIILTDAGEDFLRIEGWAR